MAAGNAFLALAGPVGWGICGLAVVSTGAMYHFKNTEIAEKANNHRIRVMTSTQKFLMAHTRITMLERQTREHYNGGVGNLNWLLDNAPQNYMAFSVQQRKRIGDLVNHVRAMGEHIGQEVSL